MEAKVYQTMDKKEVLEIMQQCEVCHLALFDQPYPYVVPINFGAVLRDDQLTLYFNNIKEGKKTELIEKNNHASFAMDTGQVLIKGDSYCDSFMAFKSVMGNGIIEWVTDPEELKLAMYSIMSQMDLPNEFGTDCLPSLDLTKLTVNRAGGLIKSQK